MSDNIILRSRKIKIGKDASNYYSWYGITSISWSDVTPWLHIDIPSGLMIHQHILSPHIRGEIRCKDLTTVHTALFTTPIDVNNHTAIDSQHNRKYNVEYFKIELINRLKQVVEVSFDGFKVETIGVENIELGTESTWVIHFSADRIAFGL